MNVHIYPSYLTNESRILRIVTTLQDKGIFKEFTLIGIYRDDLPSIEVIRSGITVHRIAPAFGKSVSGILGRLLKAIGWYTAVLQSLRGKKIQCVNSHSLGVLPLGYGICLIKRAKLVYDTHELETETVSSTGFKQRFERLIERIFIHRCDAVSVVNQTIAAWYTKRYQLNEVSVVRNMPQKINLSERPNGKLRNAVGISHLSCNRVYLYQGLLTVGRGIDLLLDVFKELGAPHHIVFLGYGPLGSKIQEAAVDYENIHFLDAVPPDQVLSYTRDADVGLSIIENICLSYFYSLPNKVFEYAAAGVPSLVSDFPEMARFINEKKAGWVVTPNKKSFIKRLQTITDQEIAAIKDNLYSAQTEFVWNYEIPTLMKMYTRLGFPSTKNHQDSIR